MRGVPRGEVSARLVQFASRNALLLAAVLFTVIALARIVATAQSQGWTYDEKLHLAWSERFLEDGTSERWSNPGYDSKTPISVPNVVFRHWAPTDAPELDRFLARLPMAAWFLALVAGTFLLARKLGPREAGPLAVILLCLEPSIIAHSTVVTVDVPLAACTVLAAFAFVEFCEQPSRLRGLLAGAALGATLVAKFSAVLVALPLLVAAVDAVIFKRKQVPIHRGVASLALVGLAALFVVGGVFGFQGMFMPLSEIPFASRPFISLAESLPWLPLPLPEAFLTGLDMCIAREREAAWNVVLLGQHHSDGVWYYFLFHWTIKTPLALIALTLVGIGVALRRRLWKRSHLIIVATVAVPLAYFSFIFRDQVGYRFTLMCLPLVLALVAGALAQLDRSRLAIAGFATIVLIGVVENVPYWHSPLSFTNAIVHDKKRAFEWVADSNLDWGQNDADITTKVRDGLLPAERVDPPHPLVGRNVLAVNTVTGVWGYGQYQAFRWLRDNITPSAHLDHTHLVFDVDAEQFERMLVEARTLSPRRPTCEVSYPISGPILLRHTDAVICVEVFETAVIRLVVAPRTNAPGPGAFSVMRQRQARNVRVRADNRLSFEPVGPSQELWYRMVPGVHVMHLDGSGNVSVRVERGRVSIKAGEMLAGTSR